MAHARVDLLLVERGFFPSRAKAQEAIAAGLVRVDGRLVSRSSLMLDATSQIEAQAPYPWVSRGGVKLAAALDAFDFDPANLLCLDLGASTGGFTDVLLARGARRIVAVDVGSNQMHSRLRDDPRIHLLEKKDARALTREEAGAPDLIVCDMSFISLEQALAPALALAAPDARLVALIKPQFEAGRAAVKKGIVRDAAVRQAVCQRIAAMTEALGWRCLPILPSPICGGDGNQEFLLGAQRA